MKADVKNTMQIHSRAKVDFYKTYLERYVSILCQSQYIKHIDHLRKLDASIKFLSCEPVIEDLGDLNLQGIDWVIVGGESAPPSASYAIGLGSEHQAASRTARSSLLLLT